MLTLEPRTVVAGLFYTAPDGSGVDRWVLFREDGTIAGEWRTLAAATRELSGVEYTVVVGPDYAWKPPTPGPLTRAARYLMGRIITAIR